MSDVEEQAGTGVSLVLGGREFHADDLTLNDVAEIEEKFGEPIADLAGSRRMAPLLHMVWCIRRKHEPGLTLEQVGEVTMGEMAREAGAVDHERPTVAAEAEPRKSAAGGGRGTRQSTGSARGKSAS